jgi:hypothetical protein
MQQVVFAFDQEALASLQRITKRGGFKDMGAALAEYGETSRIIHEQAEEGFSELVLRNNKAGQEKKLTLSSVQRIKKRSR